MPTFLRLSAAVLFAVAAGCASTQPLPAPAQTPAPGKWTTLFDGTDASAWRGYGKEGMPKKGWAIEGDTLHIQRAAGCGDLITKAKFGDFILELEFKTGAKTNGGIFYRGTEKHDQEIWQTAFECQLLDPAFGFDMFHQSGALYGLYPTTPAALKPAGEWNQLRICVTRGGHIEHWLNGIRVVSCDLDSADFAARLKKSKFSKSKEFAEFGKAPFGHIGLQDHYDTDTWFRNIRVMTLNEPTFLENLGM